MKQSVSFIFGVILFLKASAIENDDGEPLNQNYATENLTATDCQTVSVNDTSSYLFYKLQPLVDNSATDKNCKYIKTKCKNSKNIDEYKDALESSLEKKNINLSINMSETQGFPSTNTSIFSPNLKKTPYYFCSVESPKRTRKKRYTVYGTKWNNLEVSWAIINESSQDNVRRFARSEFTKALKTWSNVSKLSFREVHPSSSNIDIKVSFFKGAHGDMYDFDNKGGKLGHAYSPGDGIGGDVHFDDDEQFELVDGPHHDSLSFFFVAAHELGHALGIAHSNEEEALMAPFYQDLGDNFDLPDDDKMAIQSLYGRRVEAPPYRYITTIKTTTTRRTTTTTTPTTTRRTSSWTPPHFPYPTKQPSPPTTIRPIKTTTRRTTTTTEIIPELTSSCILQKPKYEERSQCKSDFDAIADLAGEIYFFKGKYVKRLYRDGTIRLHRINNMFSKLRKHNITEIDAAFSCEYGRKIVLFSGEKMVMINNKGEEEMYSNLKEMKIFNTSKIDAAWTWSHNGHVYILSGDKYWRLGANRKAQDDYPRDSAVWQGLPEGEEVNAAFTWKGVTYFFHKRVFWTFDNLKMRIQDTPMEIAAYWLNCPNSNGRGETCESRSSKLQLSRILILYIMVNLFPKYI